MYLSAMKKGRNWMFTVNNPESNELPERWKECSEWIRWIKWQLEKGENGTEHLQGYLVAKNAVRFGTLKKLCAQAHWEPRYGNHNQAKDYVGKEDTRVDGPWTVGVEPMQGSRSDLTEVAQRINEGCTQKDLWDEFATTMYRYHKGILEHLSFVSEVRTWKTQVIVLWGDSGVGKSWLAKQMFDPTLRDKNYWCNPNSKWWTGYKGQSNVVIDNYTGWFEWAYFLRLLDENPMDVEIKHGTVPFLARNIVITSVLHPSSWYKGSGRKGLYKELERRIDCMVEKTKEKVAIISAKCVNQRYRPY